MGSPELCVVGVGASQWIGGFGQLLPSLATLKKFLHHIYTAYQSIVFFEDMSKSIQLKLEYSTKFNLNVVNKSN